MFSIFLEIDEETPLETSPQRTGISDYLFDGITETWVAHNLIVPVLLGIKWSAPGCSAEWLNHSPLWISNCYYSALCPLSTSPTFLPAAVSRQSLHLHHCHHHLRTTCFCNASSCSGRSCWLTVLTAFHLWLRPLRPAPQTELLQRLCSVICSPSGHSLRPIPPVWSSQDGLPWCICNSLHHLSPKSKPFYLALKAFCQLGLLTSNTLSSSSEWCFLSLSYLGKSLSLISLLSLLSLTLPQNLFLPTSVIKNASCSFFSISSDNMWLL